MKTLKALLFTFLLSNVMIAVAQTPELLNYQTVIRDNVGDILANQNVSFRISILETSSTGSSVYTETHTTTTTDTGLTSFQIGNGAVVSGIFNAIVWGGDSHFLQIELDVTGGISYNLMGTSELVSVPYALHAKTAANVSGLEAIDEGNGIGWRLINRPASYFDDIGLNAIDLSQSNSVGSFMGASGINSIAMGFNATASGGYSTAIGNNLTASGDFSIVLGRYTSALGNTSTAMGYNTVASGSHSTALGDGTMASGDNSTTIGKDATASGDNAIAMGLETNAESYTGLAIGRYNEGGGNPNSWIGADPLFEVGNGTSNFNRFNALTILKNGTITAPTFDIAEITDDKALITKEYADANYTGAGFSGDYNDLTNLPTIVNPTGLEILNEGNGEGRRLIDKPAGNYDNIGLNALDLSHSTSASTVRGASGVYSNAFGKNTIASGGASAAMGTSTTASGEYSTAMGRFTVASGDDSTAMGSYTLASGDDSTAMGSGTTASGSSSTAMGAATTASGTWSTAMGYNNNASGGTSTAMGSDTEASESFSTAMGDHTDASGHTSTAMGSYTTASGDNSTTMGDHTDASGNNSTAMGRNTTASGYSSHAGGFSTTASGDYSTVFGYEASALAAYSIAIGRNTEASGGTSIAMGYNTIASANFSTAIGTETEASGVNSTALGYQTVASGNYSLAVGHGSNATAQNSTALGYFTNADSYMSTAIGRLNVGGGTPGSFTNTSPLFEIGNGQNSSNRRNALTVLVNGNMGILTATPQTKLHITGGSDATLANTTSGYLLIGETDSANLIIDTNEIMARNNSGNVDLLLQHEGGRVLVGGSVVHSSDRRLKKDIQNLSYGLDEILQLTPKSYFWKNRENQTNRSLGLIAQEVQPIIKELVTSGGKHDMLAVNYTELIPVLINAIKEQQDIINKSDASIYILTEENNSMKDRLTAIEALLINKNQNN